MFGPETKFLRYLGYHTAAFLFQDEGLANMAQGCFRILSVPKRQVAFYPLGHARVAALLAHRATTPLRPTDPAAELRRVYLDLGWHVPRLLAAAERTGDIYYDVVAQVDMPRWSLGHAVVVGDAGQGASLAVGGASLLADAVAKGDVDAGLRRFEAALAPEVRHQQAAGRRMADWFVPPTAFHNWTRDAFLNLVRVPALSGLLGWFFATSFKSVAAQQIGRGSSVGASDRARAADIAATPATDVIVPHHAFENRFPLLEPEVAVRLGRRRCAEPECQHARMHGAYEGQRRVTGGDRAQKLGRIPRRLSSALPESAYFAGDAGAEESGFWPDVQSRARLARSAAAGADDRRRNSVR